MHHVIEALFKGFGVCLDRATQIDDRRSGVPSTKGVYSWKKPFTIQMT